MRPSAGNLKALWTQACATRIKTVWTPYGE